MKEKTKEKMELFELKGTLRLCAKDLNDAFRKIGRYYLDLSEDKTESILGEVGTDIHLKVIKKPT